MLKELFTYFTTPCDPIAKKLGYLHGQVGLQSRYERCAKAWAPHLEASKSLIRQAFRRVKRKERAVVLGSGRLYDLPLAELAAAFKEVVLVDIVQSRPARKAAKTYPNVRLVERDVSGIVAPLAEALKTGGPPPSPLPPADLGQADLVISLSLMSQLPIRPWESLNRTGRFSEDELDAYARSILDSHLTWLRSLSGVVVLITDVERREVDGKTVLLAEDPLYGLTPPEGGKMWTWTIAPRPELYKDRDVIHRVKGWIWE